MLNNAFKKDRKLAEPLL